MECVNCGHTVSEGYCVACGQRVGVKRITLRDSITDFWTQLSGLDGLFFRTLRDLTLRPGAVAKSYLSGIRVKYFGPIGYFFFMITVLLVWLSILGLDFAVLIRDKQTYLVQPGNTKLPDMIAGLVSENIRWVLFLAVPFQAFAARFVFFRRSGLNYAENMVPLFYTAGHLFWLTLLSFTVFKMVGVFPVAYVTTASLLYFGYVYWGLMTDGKRWKVFLKGMGVFLGGQVFFALTMVVVMVLVIVVLALVSPESLKAIRPSAP